MKSFNEEAMEAIVAGTAIVSGAAAILSDPPIRVWGGHGVLPLDGDDFVGMDDRGIAQQTSGALGGAAGGITLELSGIDDEAMALLEADELKQAPVIIWRLIFAGDGKTLLDYEVFDRGRVDQVTTSETVGGAAIIRVQVEDPARGLGRRGQRMCSDADQRLINPSDGYFKHTAYAGEKMLYWGGKRPARAGSVLTSNPPGNGYGVGGYAGQGGGVTVGPHTTQTGLFWE